LDRIRQFLALVDVVVVRPNHRSALIEYARHFQALAIRAILVDVHLYVNEISIGLRITTARVTIAAAAAPTIMITITLSATTTATTTATIARTHSLVIITQTSIPTPSPSPFDALPRILSILDYKQSLSLGDLGALDKPSVVSIEERPFSFGCFTVRRHVRLPIRHANVRVILGLIVHVQQLPRVYVAQILIRRPRPRCFRVFTRDFRFCPARAVLSASKISGNDSISGDLSAFSSISRAIKVQFIDKVTL
jgi:hypothetical protein